MICVQEGVPRNCIIWFVVCVWYLVKQHVGMRTSRRLVDNVCVQVKVVNCAAANNT